MPLVLVFCAPQEAVTNNRQCEKAKKNLRDNKVPGLMLCVGKRSKTFSLYRRVDGKQRRIMLGRFPVMIGGLSLCGGNA